MQVEEDTSDDIISEWKTIMKNFQINKNTDGAKKVNEYMKNAELSITTLSSAGIDELKELLDYTKTLVK